MARVSSYVGCVGCVVSLKKMTRRSLKKSKVQDLIDILKYLSLNYKVLIPIEKFSQNDTEGDIYRKFQIFLIKYLQNKPHGSQEFENAMQLFKIFTRVLNSSAEAGDAPAKQEVEAEWDELIRKNLSRSSRKRVSFSKRTSYSSQNRALL